MKIKIFDRLVRLIFPSRCAACGEVVPDGQALCESCLKKYISETRQKCRKCGKTAEHCGCNVGSDVISLTFYRGFDAVPGRVTERMIISLKRRKSPELADFFARDMAKLILQRLILKGNQAADYVITYVPRSEDNRRKYSFDHGELLSEAVSRYTGIPVRKLFERHGGGEQKKMTAAERRVNSEESITLLKMEAEKVKKVILIDDIITTGATLGRAEELLLLEGIHDITLALIAKSSKSN
ncbi:MAG: ComF family protein [Clostridia bacterium]|nr:ComF family protein [Clostridia bacterium]